MTLSVLMSKQSICFAGLLGVSMVMAACEPPPDPVPTEQGEAASRCGGIDNRTPITQVVGPSAAGGRLIIDGNHACTGTVIAPTKVLTAAHCVDAGGTSGQVAPGRMSFQPQWGILTSGQGPATVRVIRV